MERSSCPVKLSVAVETFGVVALAAAVSVAFLVIGTIVWLAGVPGGLLNFTVIAPPIVNGLVNVMNMAPRFWVSFVMRRTTDESIPERSTVSPGELIAWAGMLT